MAGDRISEAFKGEISDRMRDNTRNRLAWMLSELKGEKVLDIGCSQGIFEILAAREGHRIVGIDSDPEAIAYARKDLEQEEDAIRERITYIEDDFLFHIFCEEQFDTIVLGEIIEHLYEPQLFMQKAAKLLAPGGRIIVSVPFGINRYPDHKKTYYFHDLYQLLDEEFIVIKARFMGKWMAMIGSVNDEKASALPFDMALLNAYDSSIEILDAEYEKIMISNQKEIEKLKQKNDHDLAEWHICKEKNLEMLKQRDEERAEFGRRLEKESTIAAEETVRADALEKELQDCHEQLEKVAQESMEEEKFLSNIENQIAKKDQQIKKLTAENKEYARKIGIIHNTWYGRLGEGIYLKMKKLRKKK